MLRYNKIKKYSPQLLLGECKYAVKNKTIIHPINEKLNLDESDDDKSDKSDEPDKENNGN